MIAGFVWFGAAASSPQTPDSIASVLNNEPEKWDSPANRRGLRACDAGLRADERPIILEP